MKKICTVLLLLLVNAVHAEDWLAVTDQSLEIMAGSALDFSQLVETGSAGQHGRIIATPDGHFAYSDSPNITRRFFCASQPHGAGGGEFPTHEQADRYAKQTRMHGYNVARLHFVEHNLMQDSNKDFAFNAEQLDRFYYLLAALKREGVYWLLDGLSSWNGAYGDVGSDKWANRHDVKMRVYFDPEAQAHWRQMVQKVLNEKNPYTQLTPLQDSALLGVILVNEGGLNHVVNLASAQLSDLHDLGQPFDVWLTQKYGSRAKAFAAWGESLNSLGIVMARNDWQATLRVKDTERFYYHIQQQTLNWMTDYIRSLGYQGLVTAYDNWDTLQDSATRSALTWIDMHEYHDEPSDWLNVGSNLQQRSSLIDLAYIKALASTRYWHKPFTVSEYDQPFWHKYRYEAGLAMGAYASLQHWDLICRHSGAIELAYNRREIRPFDIGMDPIARAGETLAALLYARGDVKTAVHNISVKLTEHYVFEQQAGIGKLPEHLSNLALITGLGITWQQHLESAALYLEPNEHYPNLFFKALHRLRLFLKLDDYDWLGLVTALQQSYLLTDDNQTDSKQFHSDTGEILLNTAQHSLTVNTEKTQAAAFDKVLPKALNDLNITEASAPALLAASALDNSDLAHSQRVLLIYATDARNSNMQFTDSSEQTLKHIGSLPVRIKNSHIQFTLHHHNAANLHLYALHLNGQRGTELPVEKIANDMLRIHLDLNAIKQSPTTYFELTSEH